MVEKSILKILTVAFTVNRKNHLKIEAVSRKIEKKPRQFLSIKVTFWCRFRKKL